MEQLPFDEAAEKFTRATDDAIRQSCYSRGALILEMAAKTISPGSEVLDYGCGPGRISLLLAEAGFRVRGVDISEEMIRNAAMLDRRGLDLEFSVVGDSTNELSPGSCDAIVCSSVIEYVADPDKLLRQFHSALRSPGALIISYANKSSVWRYWDRRSIRNNPMFVPHHRGWHWRDFRALLARNGFRATTRPRFFESPFDRYPGRRLLRWLSIGGSLGVLAAQPLPNRS
jgi:SAM-dependent methyltransferase